MIASLNGQVTEKAPGSIVLEVNGVGYQVFVTLEDWQVAKVGQPVSYQIYEQIREDAYNLYGFSQLEAKQFFSQLLSISGIGPKVALAILSATRLDRLKQAIVSGDPELLRGIAGVGGKTAGRIIVELKGKLDEGGEGAKWQADSTYQALLGLGYNAAQAAQAASAVPTSIADEKERIKAALRLVSK